MDEVFVAYGDSPSDTAVLLLDAAEKAEQDASVVRSVEGGFYVPEDIAKSAGVDYGDGAETSTPATVPAEATDEKPAAKKAAKKAPAKRTPAKKATAKKAAPKRSR